MLCSPMIKYIKGHRDYWTQKLVQSSLDMAAHGNDLNYLKPTLVVLTNYLEPSWAGEAAITWLHIGHRRATKGKKISQTSPITLLSLVWYTTRNHVLFEWHMIKAPSWIFAELSKDHCWLSCQPSVRQQLLFMKLSKTYYWFFVEAFSYIELVYAIYAQAKMRYIKIIRHTVRIWSEALSTDCWCNQMPLYVHV